MDEIFPKGKTFSLMDTLTFKPEDRAIWVRDAEEILNAQLTEMGIMNMSMEGQLHEAEKELAAIRARLEEWQGWFVEELTKLGKTYNVTPIESDPSGCMEAVSDILLNCEGMVRLRYEKYYKKEETGE